MINDLDNGNLGQILIPGEGQFTGQIRRFLDFLEIVLEFFNNLFWHFFATVPTFGFISSSKSLQMDSKILNLCQTLALEEGNFRPFQGYKSPFQDTFMVKSVWESSGICFSPFIN